MTIEFFKEKKFFLFPFFVVVILLCHLFITGFMQATVGFDGGWNAEVAKNLAFKGEYAVTYPSNIVFYYVITTGQTVIMPVALMYKIFGVNAYSTAAVPLMYSAALIATLAVLIFRIFGESGLSEKIAAIFSSVLIVFTYAALDLSDELSYQVLGEHATAFFIALSLLFFTGYQKNNKKIKLFFTGFFSAFAFITKNVTLFFLFFAFIFVLLYILFLEERQNVAKKILSLIGGFAVGFILLDFVKFAALGYNIISYVKWWSDEIIYCFILNKSDVAPLNFIEKLTALSGTFMLENPIISVLLLALPVYLLTAFVKSIIKKEDIPFPYTLLIAAVSGESYILFNVLFSDGAAISKRRLFIHLIFFYISCLCFIAIKSFFAVKKLKKERTKKNIIRALSFAVVAVTLVSLGIIPRFEGLKNDITKERRNEEEFMRVIRELPKNSLFITYNENYPHDVTLFTGIRAEEFAEGESAVSDDNRRVFYIASYEIEEKIYEWYEYEIIYRQDEDSMYNSVVELTKFKG